MFLIYPKETYCVERKGSSSTLSVCEAACQLQLDAELFSFLLLTHFITEIFRMCKSRPSSVTPIRLIQ